MFADATKTVMLLVASTLIAAVLFVSVYEAYHSYKYYQWRSDYENSGDWYGGLTIASKNQTLMWEYRPNAESNDPQIGSKIRTNRYGFRDRDYESMGKPKGVTRIAFIGDSVTLGLKVDNQNIFVRKFEDYATDLHPDLRIEALNFGIDGYNTIQIYGVTPIG